MACSSRPGFAHMVKHELSQGRTGRKKGIRPAAAAAQKGLWRGRARPGPACSPGTTATRRRLPVGAPLPGESGRFRIKGLAVRNSCSSRPRSTAVRALLREVLGAVSLRSTAPGAGRLSEGTCASCGPGSAIMARAPPISMPAPQAGGRPPWAAAFPPRREDLLALPGIGPYTAAGGRCQ